MAAVTNPDGQSSLSQEQILQRVFEESGDRLRVDTEATITAGSFEIAIDHTEDSIKIGDGTDLLVINADESIGVQATQSGTWNINNISGTISLPTGAAISSLQNIGNSSLSSIDSKVPANLTVSSTRLLVDNSGVIQPVSQSGTWNINNIAGTVSLPTGAATSANQATEITSLQLIDDVVHSTNVAFNKAVAFGGQFDDTSTIAATEDNVAPVRITAQRGIHVNLRNASGTEIATSTTPISVIVRPYAGTLTDFSGTATNTSSQAIAANTNRKYLLIHNPSGNTMWINFGAAATNSTPSIELTPNTFFIMEGSFVSTQAVNVIRAGAANVDFTAKEGT